VVNRRSWALPPTLLLLGSLAVFLAADAPSSSATRTSVDSAAGFAASPVAPAAVVAREGTPFVPGLDVLGVPVRPTSLEIARCERSSCDAARRGVLIETRVAEKYRSFRESLSLP
jgi:hypothetical protein